MMLLIWIWLTITLLPFWVQTRHFERNFLLAMLKTIFGLKWTPFIRVSKCKCLVCTQKGNNVIVKSVDILPHQKAGPYVPPPPYKWVYNEWKKALRTIRKTFFHSVEMERFELSSKRGINLLSTCLSSPSLSGKSKTEATHSSLIL